MPITRFWITINSVILLTCFTHLSRVSQHTLAGEHVEIRRGAVASVLTWRSRTLVVVYNIALYLAFCAIPIIGYTVSNKYIQRYVSVTICLCSHLIDLLQ